jgi:hypothetical protein
MHISLLSQAGRDTYAYLGQWAWYTRNRASHRRARATRRVGELDPRRRCREGLTRHWSALTSLLKLALEVVYAVLLFLGHAHLVLVQVGHPTEIAIETVEVGADSVEAALQQVDFVTVQMFDRHDTAAMSFLEIVELLVLDLGLVVRKVPKQRILVEVLVVEERYSSNEESGGQRHLTIGNKDGLKHALVKEGVSNGSKANRVEDPKADAKQTRAEEEGEHFEAVELHYCSCGGCFSERANASRRPLGMQKSWRAVALIVI